MDKIIPISELRANLSEITKWVERKKKPVFLTKNGHGRYVLLDIGSYEKLLLKAAKSDEAYGDDADIDEGRNRAGQTSTPADRHQPHRQSAPSSAATNRTATENDRGPDPELPRSGKSRPQDPDGLTDKLREEEERILKELGLL